MGIGELLDLADRLEPYVAHAHGRGYHRASEWAESLRDLITTEAKALEHAAAEAERVAENT